MKPVREHIGKFGVGRKNPNAKLTKDDVWCIKGLLKIGVGPADICSFFKGVNRTTVSRIKSGSTWKSVPWPTVAQALKASEVFIQTQRLDLAIKQLKDCMK